MRERAPIDVGVIGGGQLGMMLEEAANNMGLHLAVLDKAGCPASFAGAQVVEGNITNPADIRSLAKIAPILTIEIEHVGSQTLKELEDEGVIVHPSPETLTMIKDKYQQKVFLRNAHIPTADFVAIDSDNDFAKAGESFGYPFVLKARHGAYDGRGNDRVKSQEDLLRARENLGDTPLYAERFVPFLKELAIMVARGTTGEIKTFPVVETIHEEDILRYTLAPAEIDQDVRERADNLAHSVMKHLGGAGVFGIEMFLKEDGTILVNEIAPRVHNSGHYTIEACKTSQFEQHLRAITGEPLGETTMTTDAAVMVNILGDSDNPSKTLHGKESAEMLGYVYVHDYHKKSKKPRDPLRKNGHITVLDTSLGSARTKADLALSKIHYA